MLFGLKFTSFSNRGRQDFGPKVGAWVRSLFFIFCLCVLRLSLGASFLLTTFDSVFLFIYLFFSWEDAPRGIWEEAHLADGWTWTLNFAESGRGLSRQRRTHWIRHTSGLDNFQATTPRSIRGFSGRSIQHSRRRAFYLGLGWGVRGSGFLGGVPWVFAGGVPWFVGSLGWGMFVGRAYK